MGWARMGTWEKEGIRRERATSFIFLRREVIVVVIIEGSGDSPLLSVFHYLYCIDYLLSFSYVKGIIVFNPQCSQSPSSISP